MSTTTNPTVAASLSPPDADTLYWWRLGVQDARAAFAAAANEQSSPGKCWEHPGQDDPNQQMKEMGAPAPRQPDQGDAANLVREMQMVLKHNGQTGDENLARWLRNNAEAIATALASRQPDHLDTACDPSFATRKASPMPEQPTTREDIDAVVKALEAIVGWHIAEFVGSEAMTGAADALVRARRVREAVGLLDKLRDAVPTSWLDSLLTGPESPLRFRKAGQWDCRDIEALLNAVRARLDKIVRDAAAAASPATAGSVATGEGGE